MPRRTAVITGASSGIGAAFSRRLAKNGFDLLLIARRRDRLESLSEELTARCGIAAAVHTADLATDEGIRSAEARLEAVEDLHLLVNNAGFGILGSFFETDVEEQDRMHRLHILSTMRLTHAALKRMIPAGHGAIVNVSSVAGFAASPGSVTYAATKHWMNGFTEGLWMDMKMRQSGVLIQALCPGFTLSEFHDVMPMDRSVVPASWWTSAEDVVEASMRGLQDGRLFVIPGWRYRILVALARTAPTSVTRPVSVWFARRRLRRG